MTDRLGRADLHIHSLASDGTSSVEEILDAAVALGLDVIAITDHERIDAAVAARAMAIDRGLSLEVVVGEEVTTRGGHVLALFVERRIAPLRSLRSTITEIHDGGGLAIPAHPLAPYPLSAQGFALRRLLEDPDPGVRPDGIETFNPTLLGRAGHRRAVEFASGSGLAAVGCSDAHVATDVGRAHTTFPGRTSAELRAALEERTTRGHGAFHGPGQVRTFGLQLRKYGRDVRDELGGRLRRDGTRRDLGYPGGRTRPPAYVRTSSGEARR